MRRYPYVRSFRPLNLEQLENRSLFHSEEVSFLGFGSLTYSYAPDGTVVGNHESSLGSVFDNVASRLQWQEAIAKAIQTWAVHANINIGLIQDNGAPSGVYGPTRGNEQYGDIRITGFEYGLDSYAEAVAESNRTAGAWAGDVFFNTKAPWSSLIDIESAALHEVGHILGLDHSTDPDSPMFEHGPNGKLQLTTQDIALLQAIHGQRELDPNEGDHGNDSIDRATDIKGSENDRTVLDGFRGDQVWIQFGDLHSSDDKDVYEIKMNRNYSGPVALEIRSSGLSLARLSAKITDRNGNLLTEGIFQGKQGGVVVLTLDQTNPSDKYYLEVSSASDPFWTTGDYSITVADPNRLLRESRDIADWARKAHRWYHDSDRTKDGFSYQLLPTLDDGLSDDDGHSDDTLVGAVQVPMVLQSQTRIVYQMVGSISNLLDMDHYAVQLPDEIAALTELSIDVESLDIQGLVPRVTVLGENGIVLDSVPRINGFGQTQIIVPSVVPRQKIFVRIDSADVSNLFKTGSFALTLTLTNPTSPPPILIDAQLDVNNSLAEREWYIARPQLFAFSLLGQSTNAFGQGDIMLSVFDSNKVLIAGLVAPWNELRSTPGLFLDPGLYYLQVAGRGISTELEHLAVQLRADQPSKPVGPILGSTSVKPLYLCPGSTTEYCYPNTPLPKITPSHVGPPPPPLTIPTPKTSVAANPNNWYWTNTFLMTNPFNPLDVDADNSVTPLDVLAVINAINLQGTEEPVHPPIFRGHLDTNANGVVDPLDVLMIINRLNS